MRKNLISPSVLLLVGLLVSGFVLPSVLNTAPAEAQDLQVTPGITLVPPVATGTAVVIVPVTGTDTDSSTLLFYSILVLAGMAFVIMLFALMRRPSDRL